MKTIPKPILNGFICITLCGCLALPFGLYFFTGPSAAPDAQPALIAGHLIDIKGFDYAQDRFGRRTLSIRADRLTISKPKIGHVNVGGFATVGLENAVVRLYAKSPEAAHNRSGHANRDNFESVLNGIYMPFPSVKRILSVKMAPVRVELANQSGVAVHISAPSAAIRANKGDLVFNHGAMVVSGPKSLKTSRLSISPEFDVVQVLGPYVLKTPDGEYRGNRLSTDIELNPIGVSTSITPLRFAAR